MRRIKIGNKFIGEGDPCFVVAEAGANANSDTSLARELVLKAAWAGADAIKFQNYRAERLVTKDAPKYYVDTMEEFEKRGRPKGFQIDEFKLLDSLPRETFKELSKLSDRSKIIFFSTPFDEENADLLAEIGVPAYKIASADIDYLAFLKYVAKKGKPMILSTGAASLDEVREAVKAVEQAGNHDIVLLHCILSYPTRFEDANLLMMQNLQQEFPNIPIGISDHSLGTLVPSLAVALGARMIEKHFTLDKSLPGSTDHFMSVDPAELKKLVEDARHAEAALGSKNKQPVGSEADALKYARRSLVAAVSIKKGASINNQMLICKRPGTGIAPKALEKVIGKQAAVDIPQDSVLQWEMLT